MSALNFYGDAESLFYERLMAGDFYQQKNLEHILENEKNIRDEIKEKMLPDLSWSGYDE